MAKSYRDNQKFLLASEQEGKNLFEMGGKAQFLIFPNVTSLDFIAQNSRPCNFFRETICKLEAPLFFLLF